MFILVFVDPNSPIKTTMYDASWQTKGISQSLHFQ